MPKLIIIRGNSGSGKTTLAQVLQEKFGANTMLISHDMVRMKILHVWSKEGAEKSLPLMIELLRYGRQHSDITILEGILDTKQNYSLFETAIKEYGSDIFAYYYDIPFEETLKCHQTKPNRMEFGEKDMRRWWNEKDYVQIIPEHIFTQEISLDDAVKVIAYYHETLDFTGIIRKQRIAARLTCYMILFGVASGIREKSREVKQAFGAKRNCLM